MARKPIKAVGLDFVENEVNFSWGRKKGSLSLSSEVFADGAIKDVNKFAQIIKDLFKSEGITSRRVVISVSKKNILLRLSESPALGPEGIRSFIEAEASKYMIFAGNELFTDFYHIEEFRDGPTKKIKILAAIAKKEAVSPFIESFKLTNFNLLAIEVSFLAILRGIFNRVKAMPKNSIIITLDQKSAVIFVFHDSKLYYLHNIDSLSQLDQEIDSVIHYCKGKLGESFNPTKIVSSEFEDIYIADCLTLRGLKNDNFPISTLR